MSGNSILLSEAIDTHQASTWMGINALPFGYFAMRRVLSARDSMTGIIRLQTFVAQSSI
jgi:hypothetical protein